MNRVLDMANWERKDHYAFFNQFEEPFFSVTVKVDVTKAYIRAQEQQTLFFLYYLYTSLLAANRVENFRYRIKDEQVLIYDEVHASPTINRPDGTFGFAYLDFKEEYALFESEATKEIERVRESKGLIPAVSGENVIHYSTIPWIDFTGLSIARCFKFKDSSPKITFGKMTKERHVRSMPMTVHAHHALMDGIHVGEYIGLFQNLLNR